MKEIKFTIPTSFKELKDSIIIKLKWLGHPTRRQNHAKVLTELEKEICAELNSGYWSADISETMRKSLTGGYPNGKINRLINKAYRELK
ncbi:hypothetical protein [Dysgonomonas sp. 37-18]|uniref:hypothetical protein n=1 Tax=Dysgonomonas sp. 37-18 TaxID=1895907 RepID=UPI000925DCB9|nr:hypothetical protein [Dysgonomonas sp. 37-18]OJX63078.1 MAG: hypothetical protein BGO84_14335 [Dysgonomonas sp. 37-18]